MIKYQNATIKHNTPAQKIDMLRTMDKMNASLNHSTLAIEKDQIESIRAMTQYLLLEETDSTATFQGKGRTRRTGHDTCDGGKEKGLTIYERGQLTQRKKYEKIVKANRQQTHKILEMSKSSANAMNYSKANPINKQGGGKAHPTTYVNKDAFVVKQLLKKCIKQEAQLHTVKQRQKKLSGYQTQSYLNLAKWNTNSPQKKDKRKATKEQLKMIFEQVNQRSIELKKRKQKKVQNYLQERYQRQMEGVTFHPQLQSSKNLRNSCTQDFLRRLQDDHQNREKGKIQILTQQLRRDSFQPRLSIQRNSLSKSKVQSFRMEDSLFFATRSRPEQLFEKNLSRFIYPEEDSLPLSKANQSMEIALKASELQFLFQ